MFAVGKAGVEASYQDFLEVQKGVTARHNLLILVPALAAQVSTVPCSMSKTGFWKIALGLDTPLAIARGCSTLHRTLDASTSRKAWANYEVTFEWKKSPLLPEVEQQLATARKKSGR